MSSDVKDNQTKPNPTWMSWVGYVLTALPALLLTFSATMKLIKPAELVKHFTEEHGYNESVLLPLGIVELVCVILYVFPRTSVLGAILLTGYLGGAVATHVHTGDAYFMPIVIGVVLWFGLYFRFDRLRALVPIMSSAAQPDKPPTAQG